MSDKIIVQSCTITKQLHGFACILQDIAGTDEVTQEALLLGEPHSALIYNSNNGKVSLSLNYKTLIQSVMCILISTLNH